MFSQLPVRLQEKVSEEIARRRGADQNWVRISIPMGESPEAVLGEIEAEMGCGFPRARELKGSLLVSCDNDSQRSTSSRSMAERWGRAF